MAAPMSEERLQIKDEVTKLRKTGLTYKAIDEILTLPAGTSWRYYNWKQHLDNSRESSRRYASRGFVALCDLPE